MAVIFSLFEKMEDLKDDNYTAGKTDYFYSKTKGIINNRTHLKNVWRYLVVPKWA